MSIPLNAVNDLRNPEAAARLQAEFGGTREVDRDGSLYASVGNRPIPPPKALRKIHAHRQEERQQREEEAEADAFEREHGMGVKDSRTALHLEDDTSSEAVRRKRELVQRDLEVDLSDTAYKYEILGCGLAECNGVYEFSTASCHGAPVYQSKAGWTLHRGRPPVESTIGTGEEVTDFGWMLSKGGKPFYAVKTLEMLAPASGWQCFYGPPPTPSHVEHTSWEGHLVGSCGALKDAGNLAISQGNHELAKAKYSAALAELDGYTDVVSASETLVRLTVVLHANRAEVCLRQQLWKQALQDSQKALEHEPMHVKAVVRLAKACRALGCWGESAGALKKLLNGLGPQGHAEVRILLDEAELLASCDRGESKLSSLYKGIRNFRQEFDQREVCGGQATSSKDLHDAAQKVVALLQGVEAHSAEDLGVQRDVRLLLQGLGVLDSVLTAVVSDEVVGDWSVELLGACAGPQLRDDGLKRILGAMPAAVPRLMAQPQLALNLVHRLLRHQARERLKVADAIVETKGLLVSCIQPWTQLLDTRYGDEPDERVVEVFHELSAQVMRLDNVEALALALFVECFIGKKHEQGVTGGFSLYLGGGVRQVVLDLLRRWSEDGRVLQSLAPELVGRLWGSTLAKLRRDAGAEVEKVLPSVQGRKRSLKLEWFKLKDVSTLHKGAGAFYPEELVAAVLVFLKAHLEATCERGCEQKVPDGIVARPPAEEWMEEVLERPFAWGVLLPLVIAPPSIASPALSLLETLITRHPHNEKLAKRLAGFHLFMPFLRLPWPPTQPATSHLEGTLGLGPAVRRAACAVLRCTIDTEMGLRVARDTVSLCMQATLHLLTVVLKDKAQPESVIAVIDVLGILAGNFDCWEMLTLENILDLVEEFMHSDHKPTRNQLAKLFRLLQANQCVGQRLQSALEDGRLALNEEQQASLMREVFDVKTLAGQAHTEQLMELAMQEERKPADVVPPDKKQKKQVEELVAAIHKAYLRPKERPRILVMGRTARALCRCFGEKYNSCQVVLGETTLDKLSMNDLGTSVQPLLLPVPQGVDKDAILSQQDHFDLVITCEPMGYFDVGEYAEKLRPFVKRREKEEDKVTNQVQWVCIETQERVEDARDELYSAGYYKAEHDKLYEAVRKVALKMEHDVAFFALPSYEKEDLKRCEDQRAIERKTRRERDEAEQARREEENDQRRDVLCETLFDVMLSPPEVASLPVAYEVGASQSDADLVLFWLHGNTEGPEARRCVFEEWVATSSVKLRVIAATFPPDRSQWYRWSDEVAVNFGMEFYEMSEGPTDEAIEKAKKEPAKNISFGKPSYEEMQCLEELEPCCKQLLNLAEEEVAGLSGDAKLCFGGFAQGGSVAVYAALSDMASEAVQSRLCGVMPCCSGIPVFHFLSPKMQATCLAAKERGVHKQPIHVQMVYGRGDPEVKESFVETSQEMYKRFNFPVSLCRFESLPNDRFPEQVQLEQLKRALRPWTRTC